MKSNITHGINLPSRRVPAMARLAELVVCAAVEICNLSGVQERENSYKCYLLCSRIRRTFVLNPRILPSLTSFSDQRKSAARQQTDGLTYEVLRGCACVGVGFNLVGDLIICATKSRLTHLFSILNSVKYQPALICNKQHETDHRVRHQKKPCLWLSCGSRK